MFLKLKTTCVSYCLVNIDEAIAVFDHEGKNARIQFDATIAGHVVVAHTIEEVHEMIHPPVDISPLMSQLLAAGYNPNANDAADNII